MKHTNFYILENKIPVPLDISKNHGMAKWSDLYFNGERSVNLTHVTDTILVSTVFLGIDHGHGLTKEPVLFETMVFRDGAGDEMNRTCTWVEAEIMHDIMVNLVTSGIDWSDATLTRTD